MPFAHRSDDRIIRRRYPTQPFHLARLVRRDLEHPIIEMAGRRRAAFDSRESARESLRRAFPDWDPEALEGYFESALTSAEEEWRLACSPTQEVDIYRAGFSAGVLDHLSRVDIPVRILVGGAEDTYPTAWAEEFAQRCRSATVEVVEGADHFLPMTRPDAVVEAYARLAASLMPRKRRRRPALHPSAIAGVRCRPGRPPGGPLRPTG